MKKSIIFTITTLLVFINSVTSVSALTVLPYWYSTDNKIAWYTDTSLYYSHDDNDCGMDDQDMNSYVVDGVEIWDNILDPSYLKLDPLFADIPVVCLTRSQATAKGISSLAHGATAVTRNTSYSNSYSKPTGGTVYFYEMIDSTIYLVWDTTVGTTIKTSDYSSEKWTSITMHEFGHSIGYLGHHPTTNHLMYKIYNGVYTAPTYQDKLQMYLVYDAE